MTTLDLAPVTVITPWGETLEPVRVSLDGEQFVVTDRAGTVLASDTVRHVARGRRNATADGDLGAWQVREPCGCNGRGRELRRAWAGTPKVAS